MPRLTNRQYLERHRALRQIWLDSQKFFGVIPYKHQLDVHLFYAPARGWDADAMIEHRLKVQEYDSSLPQRASRGFAEIEGAYLAFVNDSGSQRAPVGEGNVRVTAIARPEPDGEKLAKIFLELGRQQIKQERKKAS
jgi:hypothetical protein